MKPKKFQIQQAAKWLRKFEAKKNGNASYVSPGIYTEKRCKQIIGAVSDKQLQEAGIINIQEIRRLAKNG